MVMQSRAAVVPARILTKVSILLFDCCMSMHDHCLTNVKIPFLLSIMSQATLINGLAGKLWWTRDYRRN